MGNSHTKTELINEISKKPINEIDKELEELFKIYDVDRSGALYGYESSSVVDDLVKYLMKTNFKDKKVNVGDLASFLSDLIDTNKDGKISLAEFKTCFKCCLNVCKDDKHKLVVC